jgi:hypothetical protein
LEHGQPFAHDFARAAVSTASNLLFDKPREVLAKVERSLHVDVPHLIRP